jgi:hypothetical protein
MTSGCNGLTNHLPFSKQPGAAQPPGKRLLACSHAIALAAVHRQRQPFRRRGGEANVRAPVRGFREVSESLCFGDWIQGLEVAAFF